jgi:glycosyltransferase involved in cell wall biosynthesis
MKVVFMHPPPEGRPSGGHVFNRHLVAEARRRSFPLKARLHSPGAAASVRFDPESLVLWDSLFLEELARHPPAATGAIHGLLVHYLPFLNPMLSAGERGRWEQSFDRAVDGMRFLLATGHGAARFLERRHPGKPVLLCEPGVDPAFAAARRTSAEPQGNRPIRIITVANLLPAKGHGDILAALAGIEDAAWQWHVVGDECPEPAYAASFWTQADAAGFRSRIVRHGVLDAPDLAALLSRMDLFAFASRFESYGMALAETVAAGLPGVTTAVGEAERIVRHGETGFVAPADDPERFREALAQLVSDEGLRQRFRQRLMEEAPRSWEIAFGDFEKCVRAVWEGQPPCNRKTGNPSTESPDSRR